MQGRDLLIVNEANEEQADLLQDYVASSTSLCARLDGRGRRRASRKKTQLLAALEVGGEGT